MGSVQCVSFVSSFDSESVRVWSPSENSKPEAMFCVSATVSRGFTVTFHCDCCMSQNESGEVLLIPFDLPNTHCFLEVLKTHTHTHLLWVNTHVRTQRSKQIHAQLARDAPECIYIKTQKVILFNFREIKNSPCSQFLPP